MVNPNPNFIHPITNFLISKITVTVNQFFEKTKNTFI